MFASPQPQVVSCRFSTTARQHVVLSQLSLSMSLLSEVVKTSHVLCSHASLPVGDCLSVLLCSSPRTGGIAGTSLAYHLSRSENPPRVALLDETSCGSQATGLSAGTFWSAGHARDRSAPHLFDPQCEVEAHSADLYEELQGAGWDCGLSVCGNLTLARSEAERAHLVSQHAHLLGLGYNVLMLCNNRAVSQVEPALRGGDSVAALWTLESGYVEPMAACRSMAEAATAGRGGSATTLIVEGERARILLPPVVESAENCQGQGVADRGHRRIEVCTTQGSRFLARQVVVAAGVGAGELLQPLGLTVPVHPVRGCMLLLPAAAPSHSSSSAPGSGEDEPVVPQHTIYVTESSLAWHDMYLHAPPASPAADRQPRHCSFDLERQLPITRHCYGRPTAEGDVLFGGGRVPLPPRWEARQESQQQVMSAGMRLASLCSHFTLCYLAVCNSSAKRGGLAGHCRPGPGVLSPRRPPSAPPTPLLGPDHHCHRCHRCHHCCCCRPLLRSLLCASGVLEWPHAFLAGRSTLGGQSAASGRTVPRAVAGGRVRAQGHDAGSWRHSLPGQRAAGGAR